MPTAILHFYRLSILTVDQIWIYGRGTRLLDGLAVIRQVCCTFKRLLLGFETTLLP